MPTLTDHICNTSNVEERVNSFLVGFDCGFEGSQFHSDDKEVWAEIRERYGFKGFAWLITMPTDNMKLDKTQSFGLTIQSHSSQLSDGLRVNACPQAGDCVKVCVLNNGNGAYPTVQLARTAKTEFFATKPTFFLHQLGFELGKQVRKHGHILFRPDVNSDLDWDRILDNQLGLMGGITSYGYTKRTEVFFSDPYRRRYVRAYSLNENSDMSLVREWLARGGNVAAVTDRKKGQSVTQWAASLGLDATVVDADETDAWMLEDNGVIGDLSAKGSARKLIGNSDFVRCVYAEQSVSVG